MAVKPRAACRRLPRTCCRRLQPMASAVPCPAAGAENVASDPFFACGRIRRIGMRSCCHARTALKAVLPDGHKGIYSCCSCCRICMRPSYHARTAWLGRTIQTTSQDCGNSHDVLARHANVRVLHIASHSQAPRMTRACCRNCRRTVLSSHRAVRHSPSPDTFSCLAAFLNACLQTCSHMRTVIYRRARSARQNGSLECPPIGDARCVACERRFVRRRSDRRRSVLECPPIGDACELNVSNQSWVRVQGSAQTSCPLAHARPIRTSHFFFGRDCRASHGKSHALLASI